MVNSRTLQAATFITLNGQKLEEVDSSTSTKDVKTNLSLDASAMTRLNVIWKGNSISFPVKLKLFKSLVVSILLYGCESWTLTADLETRIQAFEHTAAEDSCTSRTQSIGRMRSSDNKSPIKQARATPCHGQATETGLEWPHLPSGLPGQDHVARHSKGK